MAQGEAWHFNAMMQRGALHNGGAAQRFVGEALEREQRETGMFR